jgi:hypothetical protein
VTQLQSAVQSLTAKNEELMAQVKAQQENITAYQLSNAELTAQMAAAQKETDAKFASLLQQQQAMIEMFQSLLTQGGGTLVPVPAASPHRKKTRTSSHDGGPSDSSGGDSDTPMTDES